MQEGLNTDPDAGCPARVLSESIFSGPNACADLVNFPQAIEMVAINSLLAEHFDFRVALRKRTEIELHPSRQSDFSPAGIPIGSYNPAKWFIAFTDLYGERPLA